jgi:hypothetical protein
MNRSAGNPPDGQNLIAIAQLGAPDSDGFLASGLRLNRNVYLDRNCDRTIERSTRFPDVDQVSRLLLINSVKHKMHVDSFEVGGRRVIAAECANVDFDMAKVDALVSRGALDQRHPARRDAYHE